MSIEKVTSLDELKALGYFESIKTVYFTKYMFLVAHTDGNKLVLHVPDDVKDVFMDLNEFPRYLKALENGNNELLLNFHEDIVTTLLINSWSVFELIIKDLAKKDYSTDPGDSTANYHRSSFGLTNAEKKDLDLFYYIRNAIVHYNGAYYAYKAIDHVYDGYRYESKGHEGNKIHLPPAESAFKMHLDIERLAYKAWDTHHRIKS